MTEYLYLLAELAAVFAGFTAMVSVLDSRGRPETRALDLVRLRMMLELSLLTIAVALLPALLVQAELTESPWRLSAAITVVVLPLMSVSQIRRGFSPEVRQAPGYNKTLARSLLVILLLGLSCFIGVVLDIYNPMGLYHVGVSVMLMTAALQFLRASLSIMDGVVGGR